MGCMWWNWIFCCLTVRTSSRLSFLFKKLSTYIEAFKSSWWKAILRAWAHSLFEIRVNKNEKQNWVMPSSILDMCVCVCVCVCVLVAQLCLTLCYPMGCILLSGSSVHGILHARTLKLVAIPSCQAIFLSQELNPHFLHCQAEFFTIWATREAQYPWYKYLNEFLIHS